MAAPSQLPLSGISLQLSNSSTGGKVLAEYIWLGSAGGDLHSKTRVLAAKPQSVEQLPTWHFEFDDPQSGGSSLVFIKPRAIFNDPFRQGDHMLVLCDTFTPPAVQEDGPTTGLAQPHPSNNRVFCEQVMQGAASSQPVFSISQQYTLLDENFWPLGWPKPGQPQGLRTAQQAVFCGVGSGIKGREVAEAHLQACLQAGLRVSGANAETVPGQWSYTVGPCAGTQAGDQLWMSRYVLLRVTERWNLVASTDPKPVPGDWAGNGAPVKFSTRETREEGKGWFAIQQHIGRLQAAHLQHMMVYGSGNDRRLTGLHKTSSVLHFTWGLDTRGVSIHIPHSVLLHRRGYYEDRRPASNMDPYLVTMMLVCTTQGLALPQHPAPTSSSVLSESELLSRGSSAILEELDTESASFSPDTPPQNECLLAECSSQNYAPAGGEGFF